MDDLISRKALKNAIDTARTNYNTCPEYNELFKYFSDVVSAIIDEMPAEVAEKLWIKPIAPEKPAPEHDGCEGCKWFSKTEKDEPCVNCRGTSYRGVDEKPDLWEEQ